MTVITGARIVFEHSRGQDPSDSKSNWLQVDIFRFSFIQFRYILQHPLNDPKSS